MKGEDINCWLGVPIPLKNMSQLELLFTIYGKIKVMFQTTNQIGFNWSIRTFRLLRSSDGSILHQPLHPKTMQETTSPATETLLERDPPILACWGPSILVLSDDHLGDPRMLASPKTRFWMQFAVRNVKMCNGNGK